LDPLLLYDPIEHSFSFFTLPILSNNLVQHRLFACDIFVDIDFLFAGVSFGCGFLFFESESLCNFIHVFPKTHLYGPDSSAQPLGILRQPLMA
jgi:hypothetical protein